MGGSCVSPAVLQAYEELVERYRSQIAQRKGEWTVPHYMFAMSEVLRGRLDSTRAGEIIEEIIRDYPDCECLDQWNHISNYRP